MTPPYMVLNRGSKNSRSVCKNLCSVCKKRKNMKNSGLLKLLRWRTQPARTKNGTLEYESNTNNRYQYRYDFIHIGMGIGIGLI